VDIKKIQRILTPFSLLDLEMNGTCDGTKFTHLIQLTLLHYLVKFETPKMHMNTISAFNVSYKIAVKCIKINDVDTFMKYSDESYKRTLIQEHVFKVSTTSTHT